MAFAIDALKHLESQQTRRWEEIVGNNVRRLRTNLGLTQEALAHGADIDTRYVGGIERGEENPSVAVLGRIAEVLEVHPAELLKEPATSKIGR